MSQVDAETKALMDSIFIGKALRARRRSGGTKMLDGPRLFADGCALMRSGIRWQFPAFNDQQVDRELARRLAIGRHISDAGIYRNIEDSDE